MASRVKTAAQILQDKGGELHRVGEDATVLEALQAMVQNKVGSILIESDSRVVGIFTERDLMRRSIEPGFDLAQARICDVMTTGLKYAPHTATAYELMDKFLGLRLRHLLIDKDDEFIGLLSIGDVVRCALQERTRELEELHVVASWEYHEEWKPRR